MSKLNITGFHSGHFEALRISAIKVLESAPEELTPKQQEFVDRLTEAKELIDDALTLAENSRKVEKNQVTVL